ncbi:MAG: penicillin-binding protein 2 [Peptoniphilaceae bacterium]|nr:penicillin-binding protein 2 [Peptoniphilaceae bacterium]MDY5766439.1 penicillin-binding protein 2 [Peptoniphilaceae bacterium]
MRENKKQPIQSKRMNPTTRVVVIFIAAMLVATGFLFRLFYLQVYAGEDYREAALAQRRKAIEIEPRRGTIFDRNHNPLATSVIVNNCYAFPKEIQAKDRDETVELLSYILGMERSQIAEKLDSGKNYVSLKKKLSQEEVDRLKTSGLTCYSVEQETERFYPNNQLFSQTIGFVNGEGEGQYGAERSFNSILAGIKGQNLVSMDLNGNILPADFGQKASMENGQNVRLTLDSELQRIVEEEIQKGTDDFEAESTTAILMNLNNGEILAMGSVPDFNLNTPRQPFSNHDLAIWDNLDEKQKLNRLYELWKNPAVSSLYEPGSVFKTITAAVALETKASKPGDTYLCTGSIEIAPGVRIHCFDPTHPHGIETLEEALINSCNTAFVQIVRQIGAETFYSYLQSLHIGETSGVDLPAEASSSMPAALSKMTAERMATMSYGHGVSVTPLQMISAANAVVNGGYYYEPHIFMEATDEKNQVTSQYAPKPQDPIFSKDTVEIMRQYLKDTVEKNQSALMRVPGISIGGKSGTTIMLQDGEYDDDHVIASYYSAFPIENPQYSLLVVTKDPQRGYYGGTVAGEISARILERALSSDNPSLILSSEASASVSQ